MPEPDAAKSDPGPIHHVTGWRVPLLWGLGMLVRLWCRTLRFEYAEADFRIARETTGPVTMLLWHNRLFGVPWLLRVPWPRRRPVHALVSASRDGASLARFFGYLGLHTVRGSSSRFGREALQELITIQRSGRDIAITPDGPRGPVYQLKAGAVLAAKRSGSTLLLFGLEYRSAWRLRSWDRFVIPKPFSRVVMRWELINAQALPPGAAGIEHVRCRLLELSGESPAKWPCLREAGGIQATGAV